jgi:hypothetical protein
MSNCRLNLIAVTFFSIQLFSLSSLSGAEQRSFDLAGGGLVTSWDSLTGRMTGLKYQNTETAPDTFVFFDRSSGSGGIEVYDELEKVRYSDRGTPCRISDFQATRVGEVQKIRFTKHFQGAPFAIQVTLTSDIRGLYLETETVFEKLEDSRWPRQRNIRISFVLPARKDLVAWAPSYPEPTPINQKPVRYYYGIQEPELPRTGIPLYTVYAPGKAGLSIAMPLEMPKVQLNMGPEPEDPSPLYADIELGELVKPEEVRVIRFTELFVGLSADRPLSFGVWLYSHVPHWRPALGRLSQAYPEYFAIHPRMRSLWGTRLGANLHTTREELALYKRFGATASWLHTHFYRHGEFIPPEAVRDPDFKFFCEPYAKEYPDNTVRKNREMIDRLCENGQAVFLYGFNMHCDTVTIVQRGLFADVTRNMDGSVTRSYHDQPVMFFSPQSLFGRHQLEQMELMMELYPRIMGIALDNWAYGGIDFAHDDGITMFGHRPAANVNFSQQKMIGEIARLWHGTGRLCMINKARTIESMKGADSMLSEASGAEIFAMFAYMCLDRHLHANEYDAANNAEYAEYTLKYSLEWGGQIGHGQVTADPEMSQHYYALLQALRNRTWVFDPDPLTLPEGTRGNIWRIHPDSPWNPGDIVIAVIRPEIKVSERKFKEDLTVKVRLPELEKITRASWLGAEDYRKPAVSCRMIKNSGELVVNLPPVGSAGVLRLERY